MNKLSLILFLIGLSALQAQNHLKVTPEDQQLAFQEFNTALDKLSPAITPKLLEGLPHPTYEKALLNNELKREDVVEIERFSFYREALPVPPDKITDIVAALKNHSLFIPYRGPKLCEGFHPDYCLEFKDNEKILYLQICFGCHELKMIQDGKIRMCDMARGTNELLNKKIGLYRKNRPKKNFEH